MQIYERFDLFWLTELVVNHAGQKPINLKIKDNP